MISLKTLLLAIILFPALYGFSSYAQSSAKCAYNAIPVTGATQAELTQFCNAFADVTRYFRGISFDELPNVSVVFRDYSAKEPKRGSGKYGYFDLNRNAIVMLRSPGSWPWGMEWSRYLAGSFLRHELVHAAVAANLKEEYVCLRPEWHEFIAYSVQFSLMDSQFVEGIIENYPKIAAFSKLTEVNEFTYKTNPEAFAIASYKTYLAAGEGVFVQKLLLFEVVPPPFSYPFPVSSGQIAGSERDSRCTREATR